MYKLQCLVLFVFAYNAIGESSSLTFITPCKPQDVACHKSSAIAARASFTAGIPELGLPPADPIILDDVRSDDKDLKLGFKDMKVTGIKNCNILDFARDVDKSTMRIVLECPILATGQYSLSGKLLFIPAEGDGDFIIKTDKMKIDVTIKVTVVEKGGEKHWKITGFDYTFDVIEKASITLNNLYGGDETRAKPIREVLENSSKELIKEVGGPIIKELISKEVNIIQKFFKAVSISALELS